MRLVHLIARRPLVVLALATLLSLVALLPLSRVRFVTELAGLLPDGSAAAADYRVFLDKLGGFEKVFVLIRLADDDAAGENDSASGSDEPDQDRRQTLLAEAATRMAELLAASPEVAQARAGIEPEDERFFIESVLPRAPLLLGDGWQDQVRQRLEPAAIRQRVAELKAQLLSPSGSFLVALLRSDPLGFSEALPELLQPAASAPIDPLTMTFLSRDGSCSLVILTPARAEIDPAGGRLLQQELHRAGDIVRQELATGLQISALGGPLYAAQDETIIRQDLSRTVTGSVVGCSALLVLAFEGLLIPLAALLALAMALVWTGALIGLTLQQISAIGIGFAAVLVGLGIDYSIHGGARYRQALLATGDRGQALVTAFRCSGPGILTSALTTAAAFAVLGLAHLRPLRELGLVVAAGILMILLASATVAAAVVVLPGSGQRRQGSGLLWRAMGRLVTASVGLATRRPLPVVVTAGVLTVVAGFGLAHLGLDADLRALRPADHPALLAEQLLVEHFGLGLDTVTVLVPGTGTEAALAHAATAEQLLRQELGDNADLSSPVRWLAGAADDRLAGLAALPLDRAATDLEQELRRQGLNPAAFQTGLAALRALAAGHDPGRPDPAAWPGWLRELVYDDGEQTWIALRLRLDPTVWPQGPPPAVVQRLKEQCPGAAVASAVAIGSELRELASADMTRLSLLALALVAVVVLLSFRGHPGHSLLAAIPVLLGTVWVLGLWGGLGRSIDLMSLAVLPILLGIGIDDGLHAVHGSRAEPARGIAGAVTEAGRAMVLTSLTTCVGFGSLLLSRIPGLRQGGLLVATGVLCCLLTTLLVLPACEALLKPKTSDAHR